MSKAESLIWVFLASVVLVYDNGRHDLITVVLYHPSVWRYLHFLVALLQCLSVRVIQPFSRSGSGPDLTVMTCRKGYYFGLAGLGVNMLIFLYLAIW